MKKLNILYIVNFWGNLPHNYFIKYLKENDLAKISVIVLPVSTHQEKAKVKVDAFFIDPKGKKHFFSQKINLTLPHFFKIVVHYFLNLYVFGRIIIDQRKQKTGFDYVIGENYFNGSLAFLVKKIGLAEKSIFVTTDVFPKTSSRGTLAYLNFSPANSWSRVLNKALIKGQLFLAKTAYKNDLVWYISDKIRLHDSRLGLIPKDYLISQGAIDLKRVDRSRLILKVKNTIAYMGNLGEQLGVDMAIKSLSLVKKKINDFQFILVGGNPFLVKQYEAMAEKHGIRENLKFYGYVPDFEKALDIMAQCQVGLALYKPGTASSLTDVSKVKNYLKALLPVIMVKPGPEVYKEIEAYQAGFCVRYDQKQIASAIIEILENKKKRDRLVKNVGLLAERFDYRNLCSKAFREMTLKLNS